MEKKYLIGLVLAICLVTTIVLAQPGTDRVPAITKSGNIVIVPSHAVEVAEGIFSLGQARDVDGRMVQGFMFIDKRRENAKPPWVGKGKGENKCYSFFAKGAKWKTTEPYVTGTEIDTMTTETSLNTWDTEVSFDIFGERLNGTTDGADDVSPDGKNEVEFENLGSSNTIAYTIVWGIFNGPPGGRELVEWDAVFNTNYGFGDAVVNPSIMDYQNIATHEFGHALGLAHPDDSCTEETMYRYADYGETKKRDLNTGDIAGVKELYK